MVRVTRRAVPNHDASLVPLILRDAVPRLINVLVTRESDNECAKELDYASSPRHTAHPVPQAQRRFRQGYLAKIRCASTFRVLQIAWHRGGLRGIQASRQNPF